MFEENEIIIIEEVEEFAPATETEAETEMDFSPEEISYLVSLANS